MSRLEIIGLMEPASRVTALWLCLWLLISLSAAEAKAQEVPEPRPGVQIITAEEIAQAGLTRFSDLFHLIDRWHAVSIEGYTWQVSAFGLGALQEQSWTLMVDGQPLDLSALGQQTLNILPFSLSEVAYVEVISRPVLVAGVYAPAGLLHIHTRAPAEGAAVQASIAAGNEVGDPGPFRYTDFASPNIDRIGPIIQGMAALGDARGHARLHARSDEHHASDARIRERVLALYNEEKQPRLFLSAVGFDGAVRGRLGTHSAAGGFARFQDLAFVEPFGREVPRDQKLFHAGLRGDFFPGAATGLRYRLSYTGSDLAPRNSQGGIDFDWRQDRLRGNYEVYAGRTRRQAVLGLSGDLYTSTTAFDLADDRLFIPRAYAQIHLRQRTRAEEHLTAYVTRAGGALGFGVMADVMIFPAPEHALRLSGSVARQPSAAQNSPWYWVGQGYQFFGRRVQVPSSFDAATIATVDADWTIRPSASAELTLFGAYRRFTSLTLATFRYRYDPGTTGFIGNVNVRPFVAGRVTAGGASLRLRLRRGLHQRLHYTYLRAPADDEVFFRAWSNQPWHRFSATTRFVPVPRLSLYARLAYTSQARWAAFEDAVALSRGRYTTTLPGTWLLDLAVQKRFWREHGRLQFALRNFINEDARTHPIGAVTNLVFDVRLMLRFGK